MSEPQRGDPLASILGGSVRAIGSAPDGRASFATLSAMPNAGLHVEPAARPSLSMNFTDRSIGNLPSPTAPSYQPQLSPALQPRGLNA